jgi:drug/metabolite transporter (DMT)-like permease
VSIGEPASIAGAGVKRRAPAAGPGAPLDLTVFLAVLLAAGLHAGWNAFVKVNATPLVSLALISMVSGTVGALAIPFVGFVDVAALPWLALGVVCHTAYRWFLARAYTWGDLGQVYPLARGTAPLLVAAAGFLLLGEALRLGAIAGIATLCLGVLLMAFRGGRGAVATHGRGAAFAMVTAVFIAAYTVVDGIGGRAGATPHAYAAWLLFLDGIAIYVLLVALRVPGAGSALRAWWKQALVGGIMSAAAYWIAIWAMTQAPIALVAALRESSILFAAALSVVVLRERLSAWRAVAALLILAGLVVLRLA